jgi:hypothetical protein
MARHYSLKTFLRQAPNSLLQQYLARHGVGMTLKWQALTEKSVDRIARAIEEADEEVRRQIECGFQEVNGMADDRGVQTLIDEGRNRRHSIDLAPAFADMGGNVERAFWAFVEHRAVFDVAKWFQHADELSRRQWRKRKDVPDAEPSTDPAGGRRLGRILAEYFSREQARGKACEVEHYERDHRWYWFAHPEDYAVLRPVYDDQHHLQYQAQRPAFEVIFAYDRAEGSLNTWVRGDRKVVGELQRLFGRAILGIEIGAVPLNEVVYQPGGLISRGFPLPLEPEDGVELVRVKVLRLGVVGGPRRRITVEAQSEADPRAVYSLLDDLLAGGRITQDLLYVTSVTFQLVFRATGSSRSPTLTFQVSYPDSCSLKYDPKHLVARKLLKRWGIDVSERTQAGAQKPRSATQRTLRV